jgi:hypothetical protein
VRRPSVSLLVSLVNKGEEFVGGQRKYIRQVKTVDFCRNKNDQLHGFECKISFYF